jgi:glycine betaine/choline ABC-type transport system substrate-binding protein
VLHHPLGPVEAEDPSVGAGTAVAIGAADFAESATLGTIYATVLESAGYGVTPRRSATERPICPR